LDLWDIKKNGTGGSQFRDSAVFQSFYRSYVLLNSRRHRSITPSTD